MSSTRQAAILSSTVSIGCVLVSIGWGCQRERPAAQTDTSSAALPLWFVDATSDWGLDFVHQAGPTGGYFMPQIMGSGLAVLDFDNDGRWDLYFVQNGGPSSGQPNRLYRQLPDGRFADVTSGSGLDVTGYGMGVAVGDANNDGWVDVVVTEYGRTRLFQNRGDGTFREIPQAFTSPLWATSAAFVDYDRDGWLDLVVTNYVAYDPTRVCYGSRGQPDYCHPVNFDGTVTRLYRNVSFRQPEHVQFEDVTQASGLGRLAGPGLGVICADFDGDGWPDIFVANDSHRNHLWINQRDGTFREEAILRGVAYNVMGQAEAGMGIALGDVDGNGLFDLFVTHLTEETHTLWLQSPQGRFADRTARLGLHRSRYRGTGFGTVMVDVDQDGWLDIAVANGRVTRHPAALPSVAPDQFFVPYQERNQLFWNKGQGEFQDVSLANPALCDQPGVWRGLVAADLDNDGVPELIVTSIAGPARIFRNVAAARGSSLQLRLLTRDGRRDAYGAELWVEAAGRRWYRLLQPAGSYLCSGDPRIHVGLGTLTAIDRLVVRWPDGQYEQFPGGPVPAIRLCRQGSGTPLPNYR